MSRDVAEIKRQLLVLRCQRGDQAAFEELVGQWQSRLLFYIRRLVDNEADAWQLLQDVWVKVVDGIGRLSDPTRLAPWLYVVTRNTVMSFRRDLYARDDRAALSPTNEPWIESDADRVETAEEVHRGLARLGVADREVLTLYYLDDLSTDQLADVLAVPRGTIKSRLFTARNKLRLVLEEGRTEHERRP